MKPYYEASGITIYHGDCEEVLLTLASAQFDLLLADPPYGDTSLDWDVRGLAWLRMSMRLLKLSASIWCFGSMRMFMAQGKEISDLGWKTAQDLVWEKHNGSGFHADRFKRVHEHIVQFYMSRTRWDEVYKKPVTTPDATARSVLRKKRPPHMGHIEAGRVCSYTTVDGGPRLMRSVIRCRSCHGYAKNPTQKPVGVLAALVEYSCPPGGALLDPTMGAGSSLVAAKILKRHATGIEIREEDCESAARRLESSEGNQEVLL